MNYLIKKFSDNQVHAGNLGNERLIVSLRGNTYEDLFKAASIKEAWDSIPANKNEYSELQISCLIGQRSDRRFNSGGSFDLKVISHFINSMKYDVVRILDPHSDVALGLINNSIKVDHSVYVNASFEEIGTNPILISPDAGAYKKVYEIASAINADLVPSNKVRLDGVPIVEIQGNVGGRDCMIVDDIADGGRTFLLLAEKLKSQGALDIYLYVTHGMFNYGFKDFKGVVKKIYCTNSFREIDNPMVTQWKLIFND